LFSAASQRLEREYQLFTLKAGIYSHPSSPSIAATSESESENDKTRNKLFVENIISSHTSEGGPNISLQFS
jgi:hypothetical protein